MGLKYGRCRWWAVLLLMAWLTCAATARTVLELDPAHQPIALSDWGDYWIDDSLAVGPEQADTDAEIRWQPTADGTIYPLNTHRALWVRFVLPPAPDTERWYLQVPYPSVDRVSLYAQDGAGQWNALSAGDMIPVGEWPVPHRHPLLPVQVSAEVPRHYLVRIENPHSFSAPISFVSESYLSRSEQRTSLILGIYFGLAGLAVMIAVLSAVSLRDTTYALYAPTVALMALSQAAMTGIAGLHLWPGWPWWNDMAPLVLPVLTVASLLLFASQLVSLPERSPWIHGLMQGLAATGVLASVGMMLIERSLRFEIMVPYIVIAAAVGVFAVLWAWRRGDRYAAWLLVGGLPVIAASAFPLARISGLIPTSFWTLHGMQVGIAIELPVLLVILMLRSQQRREHSRRIQGMDRVDPATGLINGHVFQERMVRMLARSQRLRHQSAVLLVDIVNIDNIQRLFDRRAADELPLRVAGRLLSTAREIDSVARLSPLRFGMLLEGPLSPQDAADAGPRIVARGLMPFRDKPPEWVAQLHVAQALVPLDGTDAHELMARLEAVLAAVPPDTRRAVFTLSE